MRRIFYTLLALTLLTACAPQPAAPIATATLLPPTSTLAPTETPIPSPTATATLQPLPAELDEFVKKLEATDYTLGYSKVKGNEKNIVMFYVDPETKAKTEVPEIIINPDGSGAIHKYTFIVEGYDPVEMEVPVTVNELVSGDLEGWRIKNGKVEKQPVLSPEDAEREFEAISRPEVIQLLLQDAADYPESEMATNKTNARDYSDDKILKLLNAPPITYKDMQYGVSGIPTGVNGIYWFKDGKRVEGGKHTMLYAYFQTLNNQTYITWMNSKGVKVEFMIDAKLPDEMALVIRE